MSAALLFHDIKGITPITPIRLLEAIPVVLLDFVCLGICNDLPVFAGGEDLEVQWCPHARLVEARKPSMAEERLAMGEDVGPFVFWIHVFVETCTIIDIRVLEYEFHGVLLAYLQKVLLHHSDSVVQELHILS